MSTCQRCRSGRRSQGAFAGMPSRVSRRAITLAIPADYVMKRLDGESARVLGSHAAWDEDQSHVRAGDSIGRLFGSQDLQHLRNARVVAALGARGLRPRVWVSYCVGLVLCVRFFFLPCRRRVARDQPKCCHLLLDSFTQAKAPELRNDRPSPLPSCVFCTPAATPRQTVQSAADSACQLRVSRSDAPPPQRPLVSSTEVEYLQDCREGRHVSIRPIPRHRQIAPCFGIHGRDRG